MPKFSYIAKDVSGVNIQGVIEMGSAQDVISSLRQKKLIPISVVPFSAKAIFKERKEKGARRGRIKPEEISVFFRQLATMLRAGVSIIDALDDLSSGIDSFTLQEILGRVRESISRGDPLSVAMAKHPKAFSTLIVSLMEAGETSGNLDTVLSDLATYLESEIALRRKIKSATSYPLFIAIFFLGAVAFVTFFLLPRFKEIFLGMGVDLPLLTRVVMGMSSFAIRNVHYGLGLAIVLIFLFLWFKSTPWGRYQLDRLKLKIPIAGKFIHKVALGRFSQTLSTLQKGGVPILSSLEIAGKTTGNAYLTGAIEAVRRELVKGGLISQGLAKNVIFPRMMVRMVVVGEETGRMEEMLGKVHEFYRDEVDSAIATMGAVIEPLLIVILGVIVGITVLAIYLPIFRIAAAVR